MAGGRDGLVRETLSRDPFSPLINPLALRSCRCHERHDGGAAMLAHENTRRPLAMAQIRA
jgi:hypothetical protein